MSRVDIRINVSFKNNAQDVALYNFIKEKSDVIGVSAYIKQLIQREMIKEELESKEK